MRQIIKWTILIGTVGILTWALLGTASKYMQLVNINAGTNNPQILLWRYDFGAWLRDIGETLNSFPEFAGLNIPQGEWKTGADYLYCIANNFALLINWAIFVLNIILLAPLKLIIWVFYNSFTIFGLRDQFEWTGQIFKAIGKFAIPYIRI